MPRTETTDANNSIQVFESMTIHGFRTNNKHNMINVASDRAINLTCQLCQSKSTREKNAFDAIFVGL